MSEPNLLSELFTGEPYEDESGLIVDFVGEMEPGDAPIEKAGKPGKAGAGKREGEEWESKPGYWWRMEGGRVRRIKKPGAEGATTATDQSEDKPAEGVSTPPDESASPQPGNDENDDEAKTPEDKPTETVEPTAEQQQASNAIATGAPIAPHPDFTGFDTLGRKWDKGTLKEGEEQPLDTTLPGHEVRQRIREAKHLHEKVARLAGLMGDPEGEIAGIKQQFYTKADEVGAKREAFVKGTLEQISASGGVYDKANFQAEVKKFIDEESAIRAQVIKARDIYQKKTSEALREALTIPSEESVGLSIDTARSKNLTPEIEGTINLARDWLNAVTSNKGLSDAFPALAINSGNRRAGYNPWFHDISGDLRDVVTSIHEMAHALETKIPGLKEMSIAFRDHRCGNEKPTSLKDAFPDYGYREDEMGRKDQFALAFGEKTASAYYVGKDYGDLGTEVLSMGLQKLYEDPGGFCRKDPEYAVYVLGVLDGTLRAAPQAAKAEEKPAGFWDKIRNLFRRKKAS